MPDGRIDNCVGGKISDVCRKAFYIERGQGFTDTQVSTEYCVVQYADTRKEEASVGSKG